MALPPGQDPRCDRCQSKHLFDCNKRYEDVPCNHCEPLMRIGKILQCAGRGPGIANADRQARNWLITSQAHVGDPWLRPPLPSAPHSQMYNGSAALGLVPTQAPQTYMQPGYYNQQTQYGAYSASHTPHSQGQLVPLSYPSHGQARYQHAPMQPTAQQYQYDVSKLPQLPLQRPSHIDEASWAMMTHLVETNNLMMETNKALLAELKLRDRDFERTRSLRNVSAESPIDDHSCGYLVTRSYDSDGRSLDGLQADDRDGMKRKRETSEDPGEYRREYPRRYGEGCVIPGAEDWPHRASEQHAVDSSGGQTPFAKSMMAKMGYLEGQGLGKRGEGITKPIGVKLRPRNAGVGAIRERVESRSGSEHDHDAKGHDEGFGKRVREVSEDYGEYGRDDSRQQIGEKAPVSAAHQQLTAEELKQIPCFFYYSSPGGCDFGRDCRYSHSAFLRHDRRSSMPPEAEGGVVTGAMSPKLEQPSSALPGSPGQKVKVEVKVEDGEIE